jgi:hypothetical protein
MKKQTHIKWATGVLLLLLIAFVSETGFTEGNKGSRWEYRFKKDTPAVTTPKTEKDTVDNSKNTNYGSGGIACRDAFVLMNTVFNDPSDSRKSRVAVGPMNDGGSQSIPCTSPQPIMQNSDGLKMVSGNLTVKCSNGVAYLDSASCVTETPPPPPSTSPPPSTPPATSPPTASTPTTACPNGCGINVGSLTTTYQISKNATGTRKYADVYYCTASKEYYVKYTNGSNNYCTKSNPMPSSNSK